MYLDDSKQTRSAVCIFIPIYLLINFLTTGILLVIKIFCPTSMPWFAVFVPLWAPFVVLTILLLLFIVLGILCAFRLSKRFENQDEKFIDKE